MSTQTEAKPDTVTFTIDGREVTVPKGTLVIRAAETIGIDIPRFCDHPLLDPAAACRACMVEVPDAGNGRGMKPQAACALSAMPGMVVETANSSPVVAKHQAGMLEFLLINHPLDCPICDKGGECPLQNQVMSHGPGETRYEGTKRTYPKPIKISQHILLDRDRCVLCQRCTRFSEQISGDDMISLAERGGLSQISQYEDQPYESVFAGNIIQICPVGALTSADYRFQARPFDLASTTTTCEHCAGGCQLRTDHRHYQVKRRLAGNLPEVNEEWNCDKGRFGFYYGRGEDRLTKPLVRRDGKLEEASWPEAIDAAVYGLQAAGSSAGVLPGGRLTLENALAYSKFARTVLGTNNIDSRARVFGAGESDFLAAKIAGKTLLESVTYTDLEHAKQVVLVSFEPEDEASIVFLRLRKAARKGVKIVTIAPFESKGSRKLNAKLISAKPGEERQALTQLSLDEGTIILVGERASAHEGLIDAVAASGARWAWMPRRAGEIAAINAGCLPNLLPGARLVADSQARVDLAAAWGINQLPAAEGLDINQMLAKAASGDLKALVVGGVELSDLADRQLACEAIEKAFVVSFEQRLSEAAELADVVFPVALLEQQQGTFINWENRESVVNQVIDNRISPMSDVRALAALADAMGSDLGMRSPAQAKDEWRQISDWTAKPATQFQVSGLAKAGSGDFVLASWRRAIDDARGLDGTSSLQLAAPAFIVRLAPVDAAGLKLSNGDLVTVKSSAGAVSGPVQITQSLAAGCVWLPANSGVNIISTLQANPGDRVQLIAGGE